MNILIVKLNAIGDVLFATPLLEACRQLWPEAGIDWLLGRHSEPILRNHPSLRRRILYDGPWGGTGLASLIAYLISPESGVITGSMIDYDQVVRGAYPESGR